MEHLWAKFFESFFGQLLGRLLEPSQTASDQVLKPFGLHVGSIFGAILDPKSEKGEKVKIELSPKRELNFQGPRRPQKRQKKLLFEDPSSGRVPGRLLEAFWVILGRF